jgi:hypothetical protein
MRSVFKFGMVGAALLAGSTAFADVTLPSTGDGELVLFVRDANNPSRVYARGLGITINQVLSEATVASGTGAGASQIQTFTYNLPTISADAALSSFLGQAGSYSWTIMAGDSVGGNLASNPRRYLATTQSDFSVNDPGILNSTLNSSYGQLNGFLAELNGNLPDAPGSSVQPGGLWGDPTSTGGSIALDWFGVGPQGENGLGAAANLYVLTSSATSASGSGGQFARIYQAADIVLEADGTLRSVGGGSVPDVPVPAAFWLLGSALAGFAAIGRRRKETAATAA